MFGDSITQGFWDSNGGWAARIRQHYDQRVIDNRDYDHPSVFNLGVSADTTVDLLARFEPEIVARSREEIIVVISIGVNDSQLVGSEPLMSVEQYEDNVVQLIALVKKYTNKVVCVGLSPVVETRTTPVTWGNYTYTGSRLLQFENALTKACLANKVEHIDIYNPLQYAQSKSEHFIDGLHPDNNGHDIITRLVLPEIEKLVS